MAFPSLITSGKVIVAAFVVLLIGTIVHYGLASRRPRNFPPGPPTLPLLGNLHQFPLTKAFIKFHEWSNQYGAIVGLKLGPQNVVVLNNYKVVKELFDKRGAIYSSRPDSYVGNDLLCPGDTHILLVPYGPEWRALRKAVQAMLNASAVDNLLPVQEAEAAQTLYEIAKSPQSAFNHIRRCSTAVILASVFAQRGSHYESEKVQALYHAQEQFTSILSPGATPPVDAFPVLKYLPRFLASYKSWAAKIRQEQRTLYSNLLEETKRRLRRDDKVSCFMDKLLHDQEKSGLTDEQIVYTGGILMEAGSDTTSSTLHSFVLAMIKYPNTLMKAQEEVDGVCGTSRSPNASDIPNLPYIQAIMNETLRWRPIAPNGIPHVLIQDDTYEGYFLPKGTIIFANTWSIHQDRNEYEQPEHFLPERFLGDNKFGTKSDGLKSSFSINDDDTRRTTYAFGAGRRVCPGQHLAENSLMINMAKLVWSFDIRASPTASPLDSDPVTGYSAGFVCGPMPFLASFTVRSEEHRRVIEKEYAQARAIFARYES